MNKFLHIQWTNFRIFSQNMRSSQKLIPLTLKWFDSPPVVFQKMYLLKKGSNPGFLWLLVLSWFTSFLKILLKFLQSFGNYEEFLCQYIFQIFLHSFVTKKLMMSAYNNWFSAFFHFQHTLNRLFSNYIKLYWY